MPFDSTFSRQMEIVTNIFEMNQTLFFPFLSILFPHYTYLFLSGIILSPTLLNEEAALSSYCQSNFVKSIRYRYLFCKDVIDSLKRLFYGSQLIESIFINGN